MIWVWLLHLPVLGEIDGCKLLLKSGTQDMWAWVFCWVWSGYGVGVRGWVDMAGICTFQHWQRYLILRQQTGMGREQVRLEAKMGVLHLPVVREGHMGTSGGTHICGKLCACFYSR